MRISIYLQHKLLLKDRTVEDGRAAEERLQLLLYYCASVKLAKDLNGHKWEQLKATYKLISRS